MLKKIALALCAAALVFSTGCKHRCCQKTSSASACCPTTPPPANFLPPG